MKKFYVRLELRIGEYEKTTSKVVTAEDEDRAVEMALRGECHNEPIFEDGNQDSVWDGYEMFYKLDYVKEITQEEANTLYEITGDILMS